MQSLEATPHRQPWKVAYFADQKGRMSAKPLYQVIRFAALVGQQCALCSTLHW